MSAKHRQLDLRDSVRLRRVLYSGSSERIRPQPFKFVGRSTEEHPRIDRVGPELRRNATFFAHTRSLDTLRRQVFPMLLRQRRDRKRLGILCLGPAAGLDGLTLAMIMDAELEGPTGWTVEIHAAVSERSDESARQFGRQFNGEDLGLAVPSKYLARFFNRIDGGWRIKTALRRSVRARQIDITGDWPYFPRVDLVYMPGVTRNRSADEMDAIMDKAGWRLKMDGFVILGADDAPLRSPSYSRIISSAPWAYRRVS